MGDRETGDETTVHRDPRAEHRDGFERELVADLRSFERNTITETGTVIDALVVDYDADPGPEDVREAVCSTIAGSTQADDPWSRVVNSSKEVLAATSSGRRILVVVELPDDDVFVDPIPVVEGTELETPAARRYDAFADEYGGVEMLAELSGRRVPINYSSTDSRWVLDLDHDPGSNFDLLASPGAWVGFYGLLIGLVGYGLIGLSAVPTDPTLGAVSPRSAVLASLLLLLVAIGVDVVRTAVRLAEGSITRSNDV